MNGIIFALAAGAAMSLQGVINTRLGEKIGVYEANVFAQGTALLLGLAAWWLVGKGDMTKLGTVSPVYWLGGVLGLIITITVMMAIGNLSPLYATAIILLTQLVTSAVIEAFGLLGTEKVPFGPTKWVGMVLMIGGILLFQWKGKG